MRASDKMMNELLPERKCRRRSLDAGIILRGARAYQGSLVVAESDTVGKKCCAPHYSSGLIRAEIIYVRALLPQITPRFALAARTLKFMRVTKTVRASICYSVHE
jgi:hypothetical protein